MKYHHVQFTYVLLLKWDREYIYTAFVSDTFCLVQAGRQRSSISNSKISRRCTTVHTFNTFKTEHVENAASFLTGLFKQKAQTLLDMYL